MQAVYWEIQERTAFPVWVAIVSIGLFGCGSSGFGAEAESWNSYYYGEAPASREGGIAYYGGKDEADDSYQLPRKYQTFEGAREARIPSDNIIYPNP